jgi:phosphoribosylaminoimidazolecarboxamide formyltransferase/IMP cyclohydrolase
MEEEHVQPSANRTEDVSLRLRPLRMLRYGENAWQSPAYLFTDLQHPHDPLAVVNFSILEGEMGSNNQRELDRGLQTVTHIMAGMRTNFKLVPQIALILKHGNACGAGVNPSASLALKSALEGNPLSSLGATILCTFPIDEEMAGLMLYHAHQPPPAKRILDCIIAPGFTPEAIALLGRKGERCKMLVNPALEDPDNLKLDESLRYVQVRGGWIQQPNYTFVLNWRDGSITEHSPVTEAQKIELTIAWAIGSTSNSNTITLFKRLLIGNGVGQQDRVGAAQLAIKRALGADHNPEYAVAYSDSFFPEIDGPQVLADGKIKALLTSSGSIKDQAVIEFCQKAGVALAMVPDKIGRGFFGH